MIYCVSRIQHEYPPKANGGNATRRPMDRVSSLSPSGAAIRLLSFGIGHSKIVHINLDSQSHLFILTRAYHGPIIRLCKNARVVARAEGWLGRHGTDDRPQDKLNIAHTSAQVLTDDDVASYSRRAGMSTSCFLRVFRIALTCVYSVEELRAQLDDADAELERADEEMLRRMFSKEEDSQST